MSNGSGETVLVTGGYGCIGAETVKWLAQNTQSRVVVASRTVNAVRTDRVFHEIDRTRVTCVQVDVCDQDSLEALLLRENVTRVVHLAALQTPDCNRFRDLGLQVDLAGTQKLIEAIKSSGRPLERFVFASSAAVYGQRAMYPDG